MRTLFRLFLVVVGLCAGSVACGDRVETTPEPEAPFSWPAPSETLAVVHIRDFGEVEVELYPSLAPKTVENFLKLSREGFYDGTAFHRVIPGFMIQGGDPNSRDDMPANDGMGGPGYGIEDEFTSAPHLRGILSMANTGRPKSGGSQFFIIHQDSNHLDEKHAVFGRVRSGIEIIDAITEVDLDLYGRWGPANRPISSILIERVEIRESL